MTNYANNTIGMYDSNERRIFQPTRTDDLRPECLPFVGKIVTVKSWHSNSNKNYPDDDLVGLVREFGWDIPESEIVKP